LFSRYKFHRRDMQALAERQNKIHLVLVAALLV